MRALAHALDRVSGVLFRLALWGAVIAVVAMALAASYQVIARYVFDAPPVWTEEAARRAMVWAGMLGASAAFRARRDPTLFPAMVDVRGRAGAGLAAVRTVGVLIFAAPVIWYSVFDGRMNMARGFLGRSLDRTAEMIPVSMIWFTSAVPIAFVIIVVHALAALAMHLAGEEQVADLTTKENPT